MSLIGVIASLGSACLWAVTNMLVRMVADRLSIVAVNAYRATVGGLLFLGLFLLIGDWRMLPTVPTEAFAALLISVIAGMAFGDTLNFRAMLLLGLARSFPISGSYPLFTLVLAMLFLREGIGLPEIMGALLTLAGVLLVALPAKVAASGPAPDRRANLLGVGMALAAACLWAISSVVLKIGLQSVDVITASAIRLPAAAAVLWLMLLHGPRPPMPWRLRGRPLVAVLVAGLLGSGLSSFLFLLGVQEIGAARSAVLSATSPIFAVVLSFLVLSERPARRVLLGTLLSVAGIVLIVL